MSIWSSSGIKHCQLQPEARHLEPAEFKTEAKKSQPAAALSDLTFTCSLELHKDERAQLWINNFIKADEIE